MAASSPKPSSCNLFNKLWKLAKLVSTCFRRSSSTKMQPSFSCSSSIIFSFLESIIFSSWTIRWERSEYFFSVSSRFNISCASPSSAHFNRSDIHFNKCHTNPYLTLIRESWKKSKTQDRHRARFAEKYPERSVASFVYVPVLWNFFLESALGDCPRKWHIFLFSAAYFRTYWHMPFGIGIIR